MPAFFYHLTLEFFPDSQIASTTASLALESAREALRPFNKSTKLSSSSANKNEPSLEQKSRNNHPSSTDFTHAAGNPSSYLSSHAISSFPSTSHPTDIRFDAISIQCIDMVTTEGPAKHARTRSNAREEDNLVAAGIGTDILGGLRTKGRYIPLDQKVGESIWGIVHLYRDALESSFIGDDDDYPTYLKGSAAAVPRNGIEARSLTATGAGAGASDSAGNWDNILPSRSQRRVSRLESSGYPFPVASSSSGQGPEEDCTTLCILAVPAYLSASDFMGFVGEKTLDEVCHFRMIRTSRANRYMVLMKFRSGRKARDWQKEWNGKVFNSMEVCLPFLFTLEKWLRIPEKPMSLLGC